MKTDLDRGFMSTQEDIDYIRKTAFSIIETEGPPSNRRKPDGKHWTITDLCVLRDWMNRNIVYQSDQKTHGLRQDVSGPVRLLNTKKEDCEDHGMLFGSMVQMLGGHC